jgi:hypothetical protein
VPAQRRQNDVSCVNAKAADYALEAAVKMSNFRNGLMNGDIAEGKYHDVPNPDKPGEVINNFFHAVFLGGGGLDVSWNYVCALAVTKALETNDTSALNDEQISYYNRCRNYLNGDNAGYTSYSIFGPKGSQYTGQLMRDKDLFTINPFFGANTDTMNEYWSNIQSKRNEIFTNIITGDNVDAMFDEYISFFNAMNGDVITKEVNEWYQTSK